MEAPEEFTGSNDQTAIVKGKRTKRPRPSSPSGVAVTSSSSTGGCGGGGSGNGGGDVYSSIPSPTTSGENSTCTEEDEDMANCLILLAQGVSTRQAEEEEAADKIEKFSSRRFTEMATTNTGKAGFYVYECKTCNRTFPSFQALGGHRASHKRPKTIVEEKKVLPMTPASDEEEERQFNKISPPLSLQMAIKDSQINNKSKVHECSVCGSEFSSGQALGGHMRRHRAPPTTRTAMSIDTTTISHEESNKPRNILALDLNLPAPADDDNHRDSKFQFTPNKQHLLFSTPSLVDCHY